VSSFEVRIAVIVLGTDLLCDNKTRSIDNRVAVDTPDNGGRLRYRQ
jgi:hypothetical protein